MADSADESELPITLAKKTAAKHGLRRRPDRDILCLQRRKLPPPERRPRPTPLPALKYWLPRWSDLGLEFVTMDETLEQDVEA